MEIYLIKAVDGDADELEADFTRRYRKTYGAKVVNTIDGPNCGGQERQREATRAASDAKYEKLRVLAKSCLSLKRRSWDSQTRPPPRLISTQLVRPTKHAATIVTSTTIVVRYGVDKTKPLMGLCYGGKGRV